MTTALPRSVITTTPLADTIGQPPHEKRPASGTGEAGPPTGRPVVCVLLVTTKQLNTVRHVESSIAEQMHKRVRHSTSTQYIIPKSK